MSVRPESSILPAKFPFYSYERQTSDLSAEIPNIVPETGGTRFIHQMKAEILLNSNLKSELRQNQAEVTIFSEACENDLSLMWKIVFSYIFRVS